LRDVRLMQFAELKLHIHSSDVVLKTGLGLKTSSLRSWSWPWTVLRIWKIVVLRPKRS